MKNDTLKYEIRRLASNFGIRGEQLLDDKISLVWEMFHSVSDNVFTRACKSILENDERYPTISRLRAAISEAMRADPGAEKNIPLVCCEKCGGSGYISTLRNENENFVFRCDCEAGKFREKLIFVWEEKWREKGHEI